MEPQQRPRSESTRRTLHNAGFTDATIPMNPGTLTPTIARTGHRSLIKSVNGASCTTTLCTTTLVCFLCCHLGWPCARSCSVASCIRRKRKPRLPPKMNGNKKQMKGNTAASSISEAYVPSSRRALRRCRRTQLRCLSALWGPHFRGLIRKVGEAPLLY